MNEPLEKPNYVSFWLMAIFVCTVAGGVIGGLSFNAFLWLQQHFTYHQ